MMNKLIFKLSILCVLANINASSAQVSPFVAGRLQFALDSVCTKYKIKGTSAAVLIPNVGVWKGTNGVSAAGVPLTSDMLLGMGSNTKTHIAAVLLKMQEQNLLSLDDTIGKWITGYPNINGQITIRQCLNHTSGLFDYMQSDAINDSIFGNPSKIWVPEEILLMAEAPNFAAGTRWDYSNTNYIIAGIIISKVMNKPAFEAMADLILRPNQLTNTFDYGDQGSRMIAHPWSMNMDGKTLTDMTTTPYLNNLFSLANTAGSLVTTAEDNVQFWYKLWKGEMMSKQSWKEMTETKSLGGGDGYGLGIFFYSKKMNGRSFYSHGGTFFGFINENMVDTTSGVTISVLTNQDSVNNNGLLATVIRALHKVTLNMPPTAVAETDLDKNTIMVYPNPTSQYVKITMQVPQNLGASVRIIDAMGKEVYSGILGELTTEIQTSSFNQGLYYVQVIHEDGSQIHTRSIQIVH